MDDIAPRLTTSKIVVSSSEPLLVRDGEVDLKELLRILWRRKGVIFGTTAVGALFAFLITLQIAPIYNAIANVMIDPRRTNVVNLDAVVSGLNTDSSAVLSEIEILKSRAFAEKVVRKLGLVDDPEFNADLRPPSALARIGFAIASQLGFGSSDSGPSSSRAAANEPEAESSLIHRPSAADLEMARVIRAVRRNLDVIPEGRSYVIRISFDSHDAAKAAVIVNAYAEQYTLSQIDSKLEAIERANEWLNDRTVEMRRKVTDSERAVETYRAQAGLLGVRGENLVNQQLSELNSELIVASADRARAEARLRQMRSTRVQGPESQTASEVLASPTIQNLRAQETDLRKTESELLERYGNRHPQLINLRAQIRDIENRIKQETARIASSLDGEFVAAQARENTLRVNLSRIEQQAATANQAQIKLHELEREAETNRNLLETFLARFSQTEQQSGIQQSDSRIISRATVPVVPTFPRLSINLPVGMGVAFVLGIILAFTVEKFESGFRSSEQVEETIGLSTLALIPNLSFFKDGAPQQHIVDEPVSLFAEAFRSFRTGLILSDVQKAPKVVLMTSCVPGEGKSSNALCLARSAAAAGQKVVLVDGDLRRATIHKMIGVQPRIGVSEVVLGHATIADALIKDPETNLFVLPNVNQPANPPDVLSSHNMERMIGLLAQAFDLVVIDSPPIFAVSDALVLTRYADCTVFVVRWAKTPRAAVVTAFKQLVSAGAKLAGVVLSRVNIRQHARYGYGDSMYYYRGYKKYHNG
jgi:capsular exopolysaccharide synthesis family protein